MKPDLGAVLAQADRAFAATGDALEALGWIALATKTGTPIPPAIGKWLHGAINAYQSGAAPTIDAAMGLNAEGAANPREKMRRQSAVEGDLARMMVLCVVGATPKQAAAMVERISVAGIKFEALIKRFNKSGLKQAAERDQAQAAHRYHWTEVEELLKEYPDHGPEIEEAKATIRAKYHKTGTAVKASNRRS